MMLLLRSRIVLFSLVISVASSCLFSEYVFAMQLVDLIRERIRNRVETTGQTGQITIGNQLIHASAKLALFYERRG